MMNALLAAFDVDMHILYQPSADVFDYYMDLYSSNCMFV